MSNESHLSIPHFNSNVWRYMDNQKFEWLLRYNALYLANAHMLSDQYEVKPSYKDMEILIQKLVKKEKVSSDDASAFISSIMPNKDTTYINCWSVDATESYALWKIYLGGEKNGVAIKSKAYKLNKIAKTSGLEIGLVDYRNIPEIKNLSPFRIITTKKPFYKFENELRLFTLREKEERKDSISIPILLSDLISEIYVSPFSDEEYFNQVQNMVSHFTKNVKRSSILDR